MSVGKHVKTEQLRQERKKNGYTYEDMAKLMGYKSRSTYMYIENGQTTPNLPMMIKISKIFNKPIQYFFNLEVQVTQTKPEGRKEAK